MNLNKTISKISDNLFIIHQKMFPLYLVSGEKNFLIDTSVSAFNEKIIKKLEFLLTDKQLDSILLTHSHYDHTGSAPYIQKKFGSAILGSERTIELLKKENVREFIRDMNTKFNHVMGIKKDTMFPPLKKMDSIKDGDIIRISHDRFFKVIKTPGHTKCSLSFLLMPQKILFPGDAAGVIERNNRIKPLFLSDYNSYITSIKKMIGIKAKMLCLPHNFHIKGENRVKNYLERSLESSIILKDKIQNSLNKGMVIEEISETILKKEFPLPTVEGPKKAFNINLLSMIKAVEKLNENKNLTPE